MRWNNGDIQPRKFTCGHCFSIVGSNKGWRADLEQYDDHCSIYVCPSCTKPNIFLGSSQFPGVKYGNDVENIDDSSTEVLYREARSCCSTQSYTAAVLCCRKLLMHIAYSKGAKKGLKFIEYVNFLSDNHYIPPDALEWVDHIRNKGNEANHEIVIMDKETAEELIKFIEMLLKIIYEFPAQIKRRTLTNNKVNDE